MKYIDERISVLEKKSQRKDCLNNSRHIHVKGYTRTDSNIDKRGTPPIRWSVDDPNVGVRKRI